MEVKLELYQYDYEINTIKEEIINTLSIKMNYARENKKYVEKSFAVCYNTFYDV